MFYAFIKIKTQREIQMQLFVDELLRLAFSKHVSDIHIEPTPQNIVIRFRIDGILHKTKEIHAENSHALLACIKVLANMDIAEKRLPQDGRFRFQVNQNSFFDCRVSSINTIYGEKLVLRLLPQHLKQDLFNLGMSQQQIKITLKKIKNKSGLILVCGPTGSGKTQTLYALLELMDKKQNICTIEDPVEIQLKDIQQIEIQNKIGLTFNSVLRSLLRQDPDVILLGEIRDQDTAQLAIHAANTGHLILSTLHANNTQNALLRLKHLGIDAFDIKQSVQFIIAQRLIRKLCHHCKKEVDINEIQKTILNKFDIAITQSSIFEANGCQYCIEGYQGRTGIFELYPQQLDFQQDVASMSNRIVHRVRENCELNSNAEDHLSLEKHALEKLMAGITSFQELNRILDF